MFCVFEYFCDSTKLSYLLLFSLQSNEIEDNVLVIHLLKSRMAYLVLGQLLVDEHTRLKMPCYRRLHWMHRL